VEGPKRVRLEEESRKSKPRRRGADLRIPTEGSRRTERRSAESNSTPGFRRPPWARGTSRSKVRVIEKNFSFREASASFQAERFFCSDSRYRLQTAGQSDDSFFFKELVFVLFLYLLRPRPPRDFLFYFEFSFFFLGNEVRPEGTVPPIVGGVEE
jgi:hypothetical protein